MFFGAHACDIHALKILDLLYLSDYVDPYYAENRNALLVVGYGCWPDEKCFCDRWAPRPWTTGSISP